MLAAIYRGSLHIDGGDRRYSHGLGPEAPVAAPPAIIALFGNLHNIKSVIY